MLRNLSLSSSGLLPALTLEKVAIGGGPRIRLGSDLLVRKTVTGVLMAVHSDAVDGQQRRKSDHACNEFIKHKMSNMKSEKLNHSVKFL